MELKQPIPCVSFINHICHKRTKWRVKSSDMIKESFGKALITALIFKIQASETHSCNSCLYVLFDLQRPTRQHYSIHESGNMSS